MSDASSANKVSPSDETPSAGTLTNLVSGIVVALLGSGSLAVALELGFGTLTSPRAGTWPAILSALLIILGLALIMLSRTFSDAERITRRAVSVAVGAMSIVVAVQLMPFVGFEVPGFLLMVFWMKVLGREGLLKSLVISAVTVMVLYLIFVVGLRVSIPRLF